MSIDLKNIQSVFFLGIGGIGMSALARYFVQKGKKVSGYDRTSTPLTQQLENIGIPITYMDSTDSLNRKYDLVVVTPAVPADSVLRQYFEDSEIPVMKRSQVLGLVSQSDKTIAVAGTHGKTTTSAIIAHLLFQAGIEVTGFVGGMMANYNANYINSGTDYVVVEADEYDRSFLTLEPTIAVVLSMDPDHLDIYGRPDDVLEGFKQFINKTKAGGTVLINNNLRPNFTMSEWQALNEKYNILMFGENLTDIYYENVSYIGLGKVRFDFHYKTMLYKNVQFTMPGNHNISNAMVAMAIALELGISFDKIRVGLENFKGIKRRFEFIIQVEDRIFIDDYAHHPSELASAIGTAKRMFSGKDIMGIFQPHLYSRTRDFADGFANELDQLDFPVLTDIYPARELPIEGVTSQIIFEKMKNPNKQFIPFSQLVSYVAENNKEVVMTLGAGDIDTLIEPIKNILS